MKKIGFYLFVCSVVSMNALGTEVPGLITDKVNSPEMPLTINITENNSSLKTVTAIASKNLTASDPAIFLVSFDDGKKCALKLVEIKENKLVLNSSDCDRAEYITSGMVISKEPAPANSTTASPLVMQNPLNNSMKVKTNRSTQDLIYMPQSGYWYFQGTVSNASVSDGKGNSNEIIAGSGEWKYGFSDNKELSISTSYIRSAEEDGDSGTVYVSKGITDPSFIYTQKFFSKNERIGLDGIFSLGYAPSLIRSYFSDGESNGNQADGQSAIILRVGFIKDVSRFQLGLGAQQKFYQEGQSERIDGAFTIKIGSYETTSFYLGAQYLIDETQRLEIGAETMNSSPRKLDVEGTKINTRYHNDNYNFHIAYKMLFLENLLYFRVDHLNFSASTSSYSTGSVSRSEQSKGFGYTAGYGYEF